jgi:hypothetical protein
LRLIGVKRFGRTFQARIKVNGRPKIGAAANGKVGQLRLARRDVRKFLAGRCDLAARFGPRVGIAL